MRTVLLGTVLLSLLGGAASSQTPPTATPSAQPMQPKPVAETTGGIQVAESATMAVRFVTVKSADLMSSKLIGTNVLNNQNETLGEIEDLVIENGNTITGVVVSAGGFLGMGEHYVLIDPSSLVLNQKDGAWRAFVNTTKENLKNAPAFTYAKKK